jgi:hypothetical protein
MFSDDPDEECIIEDSSDCPLFSSPEAATVAPAVLSSNIDICRQCFPAFAFEQIDSDRFTVTVPSSILP